MSYILQVLLLLLSNTIKFIIPILFLPLSSRLLDKHDFESLSVLISFATWCAVIIEYGFNYSVAKKIKYDSSKNRLLVIINSTLSAKLILSLVALALGVYTALYIDKFSVLSVLLFWSYSFFLGGMFSFVYVCRNNNKFLLQIEIIGGCAFLFMIFIIYFLQINNFYLVFSAIVIYRGIVFLLSVFFLKNIVDLEKVTIKIRSGTRLIIKTYTYALFQISSSLYLSGLGFIASFAVGKNMVVYHLLAERIVKLAVFSFSPVSRVAYSYLNNMDVNRRFSFISILCCIALFFGVIMMYITNAYSENIVTAFFSKNFSAAHVNLDVLSIALPFAFLNGIMCISFFLPQGSMRYLNIVISSAGIIIMPICYFGASYSPSLSASISYVIIEIYIFIMLMIKFAPALLAMRR